MVTSYIGLPDEVKVAGACEEFEGTLHWEKDVGHLSLCMFTTKSQSKRKEKSCGWEVGVGWGDIVDQKIFKYSCK